MEIERFIVHRIKANVMHGFAALCFGNLAMLPFAALGAEQGGRGSLGELVGVVEAGEQYLVVLHRDGKASLP